jgi:excinuclease ABC subunit B
MSGTQTDPTTRGELSQTERAQFAVEQDRRLGVRQADRAFRIAAEFTPQGDQPQAIASLVEGLERGLPHQVLLGVTGSGKTFTVANVVARMAARRSCSPTTRRWRPSSTRSSRRSSPTTPSSTSSATTTTTSPRPTSRRGHLHREGQPHQRHHRPHAPLGDAGAARAQRRHHRRIGVSCIYGIGSRESYKEMTAYVEVGRKLGRDAFLRQLVESQFERNDVSFARGTFRVRGDVVEVFPAHEDEEALRISFFGDEVERSSSSIPCAAASTARSRRHHLARLALRHQRRAPTRSIDAIRQELLERLQELRANNLLLEAQRLEQRTLYDLEMLEATGSCKGIENYSRHLSGRNAGEPPPTLLDYFPRDFLMVIDESHQTIPQVRGMYFGDRSRKETLVRYGFRLPSAMDNRPLKFEEFETHMHQASSRVGDAGRLRDRQERGRDRRAAHPADGPARPRRRDPPGGEPGRRHHRRDQGHRRPRLPRPRDDADQAHEPRTSPSTSPRSA